MNNFADQIEVRELRQACFHEAAHEVVVHALGGRGDARVWRNDSPGAATGEEKAWRGQFRMWVSPEGPANWRTLVGLAGLVGESMADGRRDPNQIAGQIESSFELEEVSATDFELIGELWTEAEVAQVADLLQGHWSDLERRVEEMKAFTEE